MSGACSTYEGEERFLQDLAVDGLMMIIIITIIINGSSKKWGGMDWIDLAQERGQVAGCCECGNDYLGFLKCGEHLDLVSARLYCVYIYLHT